MFHHLFVNFTDILFQVLLFYYMPHLLNLIADNNYDLIVLFNKTYEIFTFESINGP